MYIFKTDICAQGGKGAAVIRGPIVSRVINQLIASTTWGNLDYLVGIWPMNNESVFVMKRYQGLFIKQY